MFEMTIKLNKTKETSKPEKKNTILEIKDEHTNGSTITILICNHYLFYQVRWHAIVLYTKGMHASGNH